MSKKKKQKGRQQISIERSKPVSWGIESGCERFSTRNSEQEIDVYLQLEYDSTMTWNGVYCPRFADFTEIFPAETAPYCDGRPAENPTEDILLHLQERFEYAVGNASPNTKAWILRERGIAHFKCHFYHIVSYCHVQKDNGHPRTIDFFNKLTSQKEQAQYKSLCEKGSNRDFYLSDFPETNLTVHFVKKFRANDGFVRAITIDLEKLEEVLVTIDAEPSVNVTGASILLNDNVVWCLSRKKQESNSYYFSYRISLAQFMEIPEKFKIEVKTDNKVRTYDYPSENSKDETVKFTGNRKLSDREQLKKCVLFMDMGSTRTKYVLVPQNGNELDLRNITPEVVITKNCIDSTLPDPHNLHILRGMDSFIEGGNSKKIKIEPYRIKKEIVKEDLLEEFFSEAVKTISDNLRKQKIILTGIYWSFPQTSSEQNKVFQRVAQNVSNAVKSHVCSPRGEQCFFINPEHIALKNAFTHMIHKILIPIFEDYNKALENRCKNAKIEYEYAKATRSLLDKIYSIASDPKYDSWQSAKADVKKAQKQESYQKMQILYDEVLVNPQELRNFLLLDGGGYSLDAYCEINGQEVIDLSRSFECGGEQLFDEYLKVQYKDIDREKILSGKDRIRENEIKQELFFPDKIRYNETEKITKIKECVDRIFEYPYTLYDNISGREDKIKIVALTGQVMGNLLLKKKFVERTYKKGIFFSKNYRAVLLTTPIFFELFYSVPEAFQRKYEKEIDDLKTLVDRGGDIVSDFDLLTGMLYIAKGKKQHTSLQSHSPKPPSKCCTDVSITVVLTEKEKKNQQSFRK